MIERLFGVRVKRVSVQFKEDGKAKEIATSLGLM